MVSRKNGFDRPFTRRQVISWLMISANTFSAILIEIFNIDKPVVSTLFIVFLVSLIPLTILGYFATSRDPSQEKEFLSEIPSMKNEGYFCSNCEIFVSKTTIHCLYCNKCIEGFDHHCLIINNCIGAKNYKLFMCLVISMEVQQSAFLVFLLETIIKTTFDSDNVLLLSYVFLLLFLNFWILVYNSYILFFHIMISCKQMTTIEYNRSRKAQKEAKISPDINIPTS